MKSAEGGFTLVELMVILVIGVTLTLVAVPSLISLQRSSDLNAATNSLVASLNAARGEAMRAGTGALVSPVRNNDWAGGWRAFIDANVDGQFQTTTDRLIFESTRTESTLLITGTASAADSSSKYIAFDASGYLKNSSGAFESVTFTIQRADNTSAEGIRLVKVAKTGRVRSCRPAEDASCTSADD